MADLESLVAEREREAEVLKGRIGDLEEEKQEAERRGGAGGRDGLETELERLRARVEELEEENEEHRRVDQGLLREAMTASQIDPESSNESREKRTAPEHAAIAAVNTRRV